MSVKFHKIAGTALTIQADSGRPTAKIRQMVNN